MILQMPAAEISTLPVDGRNPANQLRLVVEIPIIYEVLYMPGGARISSINSIMLWYGYILGPAKTP